MRRKFRGGHDEDLMKMMDEEWAKPMVIFGGLALGMFIVSIIVWSVFNYFKIKINNIWISLLIAIPTTLLLNELFVGNSMWRTDDGRKSFRLGSIPITLFSPLDIFGLTGFSRLYLWLPPYWTQNVFIIWWATFLILTYIRK